MPEILSLKYGKRFSDSSYRTSLTNRFENGRKNYEILKSDIMKSYYIEIENIDFDYYGKSDYKFIFWKDIFSGAKVNLDFPFDNLEIAEKVLNELLIDLDNFSILKRDSTYPKINVKLAMQDARKLCKEGNYKELESKSLGASIWRYTEKSGTLSHPIVTMSVNVTKGIRRFNKNHLSSDYERRYEGSWLNFELSFLDERTAEFYDEFSEKNYEINFRSYIRKDNDGIFYYGTNGKGYRVSSELTIPIKETDGVYKLPITINNVLTLDFILDPGASDVSITTDVFLVLIRTNTIKEDDFIGTQSYQFADGTTAKSDVFNLKSLKIGGKEIENVRVSVSKNLNAPLLLGQSALKKLKSYKIDPANQLLIIE
jgi:aspartyl protease family protein